MTVTEIIEEARSLPPDQVAELVDRLTIDLHGNADPLIENEWKAEARVRLAEIEKGEVHLLSGEEVSAKIRRLVGS